MQRIPCWQWMRLNLDLDASETWKRRSEGVGEGVDLALVEEDSCSGCFVDLVSDENWTWLRMRLGLGREQGPNIHLPGL